MNESIDLLETWYDKAVTNLSVSSPELAEQIRSINGHVSFAEAIQGPGKEQELLEDDVAASTRIVRVLIKN